MVRFTYSDGVVKPADMSDDRLKFTATAVGHRQPIVR
jgi:hypothetical protein